MGAGIGALGALGVEAIGTTTASAAPAPTTDELARGLLGAWILDARHPQYPALGSPVPRAIEVVVFAAGGALIVNGQLANRVDLGTWKMIDAHNFEYCLVTVLFNHDDYVSNQLTTPPAYACTVIGVGSGTLNSDFTKHTAREDYTVYDQCNNVLARSYQVGTATKIPVTGFTPTLNPGAQC
jgi:hypothetical protein